MLNKETVTSIIAVIGFVALLINLFVWSDNIKLLSNTKGEDKKLIIHIIIGIVIVVITAITAIALR